MKLSGKNVLITGGAGFIGSNLVDRIILENPSSIVVVDNFFLGKEENLSQAFYSFPNLRLYRLDASDFAAMLQLVTQERIDVVFDLAVIPLPTCLEFPIWTMQSNIQIVSTFCELARLGHIKTLVHCSSSEAYGSAQYMPMDEKHPLLATTPYAASKAAGDQIIRSYIATFGIDAVIVRPFNNFGPRQNDGSYAGIIPIVVNRVMSGNDIEIFGDGNQTRDYIFVSQTVEALVKIYESEKTRGMAINVSSGYEITINDLVRRMIQIMGRPDHPIVHGPPRRGDVRKHCGDVSLLYSLTQYEPKPISDEDLAITINYYQRRK